MSYCLNPNCANPTDPINAKHHNCYHCGSELLVGGRYRIIKPLANHSCEKIFEVEEAETVKILKLLLLDDPMAVALFQQQALLLGKLDSPGIPKIESAGCFIGLPFGRETPMHGVAIEKIEGVNLRDWLNSGDRQPITQELALNWLKQLTEILQKIHQIPYFHLNIKPSNIILTPSEELVLIDFSAARELICNYMRTLDGRERSGENYSIGYTPIEQLNHQAVEQSDFFALARTIVHLLTGTHPLSFYNSETSEFHWRDAAAHVCEPFADLLDRLMAQEASQRPKNAAEILQQLTQIEESLEQSQAIVHSPIESHSNNGSKPPEPSLFVLPTISAPEFTAIAGSEAALATTPAPGKLKINRKSLRFGHLLALWGLIGFSAGIIYLFLSTSVTKAHQCNKLISVLNQGGEKVRKLEGTDATTAKELAAQLEKVASQLVDIKLSDAKLQAFPKRLSKNYEELSQAFRTMAEAIAVVDAAPLTKAGLDEVKGARKKAEEAGKLATQAAKNADAASGEIELYCSQ